jgi:pyruvate/2-oxoglutarate dehydrogenase complex dihydrolipoamide dehydrogenase (E3) component
MQYDVVIIGAGSAGCVFDHRIGHLGRLSIMMQSAHASVCPCWMRVPPSEDAGVADAMIKAP